MTGWWRWSRPKRELDLDDEIASHFRLAVADRIAGGETRAQAEAAVRREFGNEALVKEVTRSMWRGAAIERLWGDFALALRTLRRTPRFATAAITCIAIGVGVTTTIFSALHGILLRPLPYPNATELIAVRAQVLDGTLHENPITPEELQAWGRARTITQLSAWQQTFADFTGPEDTPERVISAQIAPGLFDLLGVAPLHGRRFDERDLQPGVQPSVLLSYELWRRRFGEDSAIIGRTIDLYRKPYVVAGVMPPGFSFPDGAAAWTPLVPPANLSGNVAFYSGVIARRTPQSTLRQVQAEFDVINRELTTQGYSNWKLSVVSLREQLVGALRKPVLLFQGAAVLVLIIACANVAALLLARGSARRRELAVRAAIGASRTRLIGHVLVECVALALIGGAFGIVVALAGVRLLTLSFPDGVPSYIQFSVQGPVLAFTFLLSLLSAVGFGVVPAMRAGRTRSDAALRTASRATQTAGLERRGTRDLLITTEIALSVILVVFAAGLVRSERLLRRSVGFQSEGVLTARVPVPVQLDRYRSNEARQAFYQTLLDQLATLPGVLSVSASHFPAPLDGDAPGFWNLLIDGERAHPDGGQARAAVLSITPGYIKTIGVRLVVGRDVSANDSSGVERAALVNQTFARKYFPSGSALGHRLAIDLNDGTHSRPMQIVGVVADFRQQRPPAEIQPTIFIRNELIFPLQTFLLRTQLPNPATLGPAVRATVRALDPTLVPFRLETQTHLMQRSFWRERLQGNVVGLFALLALLLAVFGMYGVLSYAVAQRTSELGVRVALGASPRQLLMLVLTQAARAGIVGITIGLAGALALSRLVSGLLYGVSPTDPRSLVFSGLLLLVVAVVSSVLPARRAARLDPVTAIRQG